MKPILPRRDFLKLSGAAVLGAALSPSLRAASAPDEKPNRPGAFEFIFFTDTHLQPELMAQQGCETCFKKITSLKPEFAICGGDLVFDAAGVPRERADHLFNLYSKTEQILDLPLHHAIGNHDVFGLNGSPAAKDPMSGKKLYQDRFGQTYYSFDHKGHHFIVLDSISLTPSMEFEARVDEEQLRWLAADLNKTTASTPIIVTTHVPLVTGFLSYATPSETPSPRPTLVVGNAHQVLALLEGYRVIAVLQGHTHINEVVVYKDCHYITSGAVSGNWWKGSRWGHPEGFTVLTVNNGQVSHRYETYGFKSVG